MTGVVIYAVVTTITTIIFMGWALFLGMRLQAEKAETHSQKYAKESYTTAYEDMMKERNQWMERHEALVKLIGEIATIGGYEQEIDDYNLDGAMTFTDDRPRMDKDAFISRDDRDIF